MAINQGTRGPFKVGTLVAAAIKIGSTALAFTAAQFNQVMAAFGAVTFDRALKIAKVSIGGTALHAGVLAWANPEAVAIVITRCELDITTPSTGSSTIDVGITAVSATTGSDTLLDGVSGTPAALFDSGDAALDTQANTKAQKLAVGKWVTFQEKTGDVTGLVASAYIEYHLV